MLRYGLKCSANLALILGLLLLVGRAFAQEAPRYSAMLNSGERITGQALADWHDANANPRLDNRQLFEAGNPMRWLIDHAQPAAVAPQAYIETHLGDRLPGRVVEFHAEDEFPFEAIPAHVVIEPTVPFEPPQKPQSPAVRVLQSSLKRIVWQRRSKSPYVPGQILYRDGRSLIARAVRLENGYVSALLAEGPQRISWGDLAEIHFPEVDFWSAYWEELAVVSPSIENRMIQVETSGGLTVTTSLARTHRHFNGNPQDSKSWLHAFQPAWSLDLLWIPSRDIAVRRSFLPTEVPLSRVPSKVTKTRSLLSGSGGLTNVNQNALGGPMRTAKEWYGWGIGTQAQSELAFAFPKAATVFRSLVSLDRVAGQGGCIRARVFTGAGKELRWESPFLIGSETIADTGTIPLAGDTPAARTLVLQIDAAHDGRPANADPFDIRDHADWGDALITLDPAQVKQEVNARLSARFFAWNGANVRFTGEPLPADFVPEVMYARHDATPSPGRLYTTISGKGQPLVIAKQFPLKPTDNWLVISAVRLMHRGPEPKLEVFIQGAQVAEGPVPHIHGNPDENRPLAISLAPYQKQAAGKPTSISVEIRQVGAADSAPVHYRGIYCTPELPTIYRIYDEPTVAMQLPKAKTLEVVRVEASHIVKGDTHSGESAIKVLPDKSVTISFPKKVAIREQPKWGEYRFVRFAFRKKGEGRVALEAMGNSQRLTAARMDAGKGEPSFGGAVRFWNDKLPDQWTVHSRDLFQDFGAMDLDAITLGCPDGEYVLFDHIYLARGWEDFNLIPGAPPAEQTNEKAREEIAKNMTERVSPAIVGIQFANGRMAGGVIVRREGEILTAGHLLGAPGQEAKVQLADGKVVTAKTLGICRDLDLGMLKVEPPGEFPAANLYDRNEVDIREPFATLLMPGMKDNTARPQVNVTFLRQNFGSFAWSELDPTEWTAGGVLLNRAGQVVGVHVRRNPFGGAVFTRLNVHVHTPSFDKMRQGQVFGAWPVGSEPVLGLEVKRGKEKGLQITKVVAGSPAATAGLSEGQILMKADGLILASPDDLSKVLCQKDEGQEITLDFDPPQEKKVKLAPR